MIISIPANPGQPISMIVEVLNAAGYRTDGYSPPKIDYVMYPDGSSAGGFPQDMVKIDLGLFKYTLIMPMGILGTYVAGASWTHPSFGNIENVSFAINVHEPFGNYSIIPA